MPALLLSFTAFLLSYASLLAAEVQVAPPKPAPAQMSQTPWAAPPATLPQYRPALLGTGPLAVINRIDRIGLLRKGQKDATLMFRCSVTKTGEIAHTWIYRATPESTALEQEVLRCLGAALVIPAIYNYEPVDVLFYGTVSFKNVMGKPRLRIFANQETKELEKESDFIGPQPFAGGDSKFAGLHYPKSEIPVAISGLVELALKIDAEGNLKELTLVSEYPPLAGFGQAATEDFKVAKFIPAFRDGKPVECSITLPVYYEP
jgi:TonB-like protein